MLVTDSALAGYLTILDQADQRERCIDAAPVLMTIPAAELFPLKCIDVVKPEFLTRDHDGIAVDDPRDAPPSLSQSRKRDQSDQE